MKISILTLFPEIVYSSLNYSILKRAIEKKIVDLTCINIRDFSTDKHKTVDDHPYGGGAGMLMKVDVVDRAIRSARCSPIKKCRECVILLDPKAKIYTQKKARTLSRYDHLILLCGHYEGIDERIRRIVDQILSIGEYVLTGGEIAAMVITDSVVRLLPGVLQKPEATHFESYTESLLEYPQYTRPEIYNGLKVPEVLLSGNHQKISVWRKNQAIKLTKKIRPELLLSQK